MQHFLGILKTIVCTSPHLCTPPPPPPLCPKLIAAILRQQQEDNKIKFNNHIVAYNNNILSANIFTEVHWLKSDYCQIPNLHQQVKHIP